MDIVFEVIFEVVFEGLFELATNKNISPWIRYPILILVSIVFLFVVGLLIYQGIDLMNDSVIGGIIVLLIGLFIGALAVFGVVKKLKS